MDQKRIVCIGLGPSNLALAIALTESQHEHESDEWIFIEKNDAVRWHSDMLLEGSRLQISFLKDLVTLRNPTSFFTFINYLKSQGRLDYFINRGTFNASRREFMDYLNWVHQNLPAHLFQMSSTVESVSPIRGLDGTVEQVEVTGTSANGERFRRLADRLVVAVGGIPAVPDVFRKFRGGRLFHSSEFLTGLKTHCSDKQAHLRFGVVGSGQSAVEIIHYLSENYPLAQVHSIFRKSAYKPADNSPFVNEVFFPSATDFMYNMPNDNKRRLLLRDYWQTNYAAVEMDLLESLYEKLYASRVCGEERIHIHNYSEVDELEEVNNRYKLGLSHVMTGEVSELELDVIVLATGYERTKLPAFLDPIASYINRSNDMFSISRDYRLQMTPSFKPRIYVQGMSQLTHGISDSLLSVLAMRSQEILESILQLNCEESGALHTEEVLS